MEHVQKVQAVQPASSPFKPSESENGLNDLNGAQRLNGLNAPSAPLTVVGWLWRQPSCAVQYTPAHANTWARMLHRHLSIPHRFVLLTDYVQNVQSVQPASPPLKTSENGLNGLNGAKRLNDLNGNLFDPLIEPIPLWKDWRELKHEAWGLSKPYCYVRLKAFSEEMRALLGERFVSIDLDCVVLQNIDALFERDEDFMIIRRTLGKYDQRLGQYQASMWMMNAGARKQVWEKFKGHESIVAAREYLGSDQAWLNYILPAGEKSWGQSDGVYGFIDLYKQRAYKDAPPKDARIIFFNGALKPWEFRPELRPDYAWIAEHYGEGNRQRAIGNRQPAAESMRDISPMESASI